MNASSRGPIKVVHVATVDVSLRILLLNQLVYLKNEGYEVTGISAPGPHAQALEDAGVKFLGVPMTRRITPLADLEALFRLITVFRRERFDIVHTHTPKAGLLGLIAARLTGVPIAVSTIHGFYFYGMTGMKRRFFVAMEKVGAACANSLLSQSQEDVELADKERIGRSGQTTFLGNGIDLHQFSPDRIDPRRTEELQKELGIAADEVVVGFVGRLVRMKGIFELLEAIAVARTSIPRLRLLIVGPEDREKADAFDRSSVSAMGLDDTVVFAGFREDMPDVYALMDVFVLPSYREGFPRSCLEASAMGVPAIVSDVRGCREAVEEGVNGLRVPVRDAASLAAALIGLLGDRHLLDRLGEGGRAVALRRFDERAVFRRVAEEYERQLSRVGLNSRRVRNSA